MPVSTAYTDTGSEIPSQLCLTSRFCATRCVNEQAVLQAGICPGYSGSGRSSPGHVPVVRAKARRL
jgi:hypothetical protein